jgi:TPR repeat protein
MFRVVSGCLLLLALVGCASTQGSKENLYSNKSYLDDHAFIEAYLSFVEADSQYLKTFSAESKKALASVSQNLKAHADSGNPIAQLSYGNSQYLIDYKSNARLFKNMLQKSASSGYLPANRKLAQFYRSGQHFGKQEGKALEILESNASYGHERDIKVLLVLYKKLPHIGVNSEKYKELEKKLELSRDVEFQHSLAKKGDLSAQRIYGHMLYHGKNTKKDYLSAAIWLSIAANNKANSQAAFDSARAIYALSKLTESERIKVDEYVNRFIVTNSET